MVNVGTLIAYLKLDSSDYENKMVKAKTDAEKLKLQHDENIKNLGLLVGGFTAAAGASYMLSEKYGGQAQELKDLSYQTGLTTTELQKMQYAAVLSGTSFSQVAVSLNRLTVTMGEAKDKTSAAYKAFMSIGVDPTGKTPKQVFDEVTAALTHMASESDRNAAAMAIFGRSYKDLLPYMENYIKNAKDIEAHPGFSEEDQKILESNKVSWDKLTYSINLYFGTLVAGIDRLQTKLNESNLVQKFFGWVGEESKWDKGPSGGALKPSENPSPESSISDFLISEVSDSGSGSSGSSMFGSSGGGGGSSSAGGGRLTNVGVQAAIKAAKCLFSGDIKGLIAATEEMMGHTVSAPTALPTKLPPGTTRKDLDWALAQGNISYQYYNDHLSECTASDQWSSKLYNTGKGWDYSLQNPASPISRQYADNGTDITGSTTSGGGGQPGGDTVLKASDLYKALVRIRSASWEKGQTPDISQEGLGAMDWFLSAAYTGGNNISTGMASQALLQQAPYLLQTFQTEYNRLTSGPQAKYDKAGNAVIYVMLDGKQIAQSQLDLLKLLGVKT